jgi:hypothetical protein
MFVSFYFVGHRKNLQDMYHSNARFTVNCFYFRMQVTAPSPISPIYGIPNGDIKSVQFLVLTSLLFRDFTTEEGFTTCHSS